MRDRGSSSILDQPTTGLGDLLVPLLTLDELVAMTERNGVGELVCPLSFGELFLDGLPELEIVTALLPSRSRAVTSDQPRYLGDL